MQFLVADIEPFESRRERRKRVGKSSGETFADTLLKLFPQAVCSHVEPADTATPAKLGESLTNFAAVFITGSPLHLYDVTAEVQREVAFMRGVFASGVPAFGSCAGLQLATVSAGGKVAAMPNPHEVGFARRIYRSPHADADHPMLFGRPTVWDAFTIHSDEVSELPPGSAVLASNSTARVQAAEIRCGRGIFWGTQYHPELPLRDVAQALRMQAEEMISQGLVRDSETVERHADLIKAMDVEPDRLDLAWRLGVDKQVTDFHCRTTEIRNFVDRFVR